MFTARERSILTAFFWKFFVSLILLILFSWEESLSQLRWGKSFYRSAHKNLRALNRVKSSYVVISCQLIMRKWVIHWNFKMNHQSPFDLPTRLMVKRCSNVVARYIEVDTGPITSSPPLKPNGSQDQQVFKFTQFPFYCFCLCGWHHFARNVPRFIKALAQGQGHHNSVSQLLWARRS